MFTGEESFGINMSKHWDFECGKNKKLIEKNYIKFILRDIYGVVILLLREPSYANFYFPKKIAFSFLFIF